jgi:hypothetical protein
LAGFTGAAKRAAPLVLLVKLRPSILYKQGAEKK